MKNMKDNAIRTIVREEIEIGLSEIKESINAMWTLMDELVGEVRESRRERVLLGGRYVDIDNQVVNHEKRIVILEKK